MFEISKKNSLIKWLFFFLFEETRFPKQDFQQQQKSHPFSCSSADIMQCIEFI